MNVQDLTDNPNIARLTRLTRELEQSRTAGQTLRALQRGFADVSGFVGSLLVSTRGLPPGQYRVVRLQMRDEPQDVPAEDLEEQGPVRSGGILAAIVARREPQLIQDVDWSQDPHFRAMFDGYSSIMAIPLAGARLPMGWVILLQEDRNRFSVSDMEEALERAAIASSLMENQMLAGELAHAHKLIDQEARQVGELQRALLPASLPRIAGLEMAASYEPSGRAGGDLYDFFPLDESGDASVSPSHWCVFIGDIAGHGLAAAVVMAIVQAVLHARPAGIAGPAGLLMHVNRQLCSKRLRGFVTAFLGVYQPDLRRLIYANAGHPPPLLRRSSDRLICELDEVGSYPLGIHGSESFQQAAVQLEPGDMILLYTDGITEARDLDGNLFERDRLMRAFPDGRDQPAELIDHLRAAVRAHEHGQAAKDDQTLVAAQVL